LEYTNLSAIKLTYKYPSIKDKFLNKESKYEKRKRKRRQHRIIIWKMILQDNDGMCG
jgi:hypothetical protein